MIDLTGEVFGRWTVLGLSKIRKANRRCWNVQCICGNSRIVNTDTLNNGESKSCGCLSLENKTKHGMCGTPIYKLWIDINRRCNDPNNKRYHRYGGRGIKVCDRWRDFRNFFKDMGFRPEGMSVERVNNDKGYSPDNCKWATCKEQSRNKVTNHLVTYLGETKTIAQWAEEFDIEYSVFYGRIKLGWPMEKALTEKIRRRT